MKLTFKELREREVINVTDGRSLGKIIDLTLDFPEGKLVGITVPGRNINCLARLFDRSTLYIDVKQILKIGGDVILVKISCNENIYTSHKKRPKQCGSPPPCPSPDSCEEEGYFGEDRDYTDDY